MKMSNVVKKLAVATGLCALTAWQASAIVVYNNPGGLVGNELAPTHLTLGMDFTINAGPTGGHGDLLTAVGAFLGNRSSFPSSEPVTVAVFDVTTGLEVPGSQFTFSGNNWDYMDGSSAFHKLQNPIQLLPGTYSIVAANYGRAASGHATDFNAPDVGNGSNPVWFNSVPYLNFGSSVTMIPGGRIQQTDILGLYPRNSLPGAQDPIFAAGTLELTPLPETSEFAVAGIALLGLVYVGRNVIRRKAVA